MLNDIWHYLKFFLYHSLNRMGVLKKHRSRIITTPLTCFQNHGVGAGTVELDIALRAALMNYSLLHSSDIEYRAPTLFFFFKMDSIYHNNVSKT